MKPIVLSVPLIFAIPTRAGGIGLELGTLRQGSNTPPDQQEGSQHLSGPAPGVAVPPRVTVC